MRTVTFYSYKGGAGRSLLLANTALFLAESGCSVVAVDLDLEAPGLHSKFGLPESDPRLANGLVRYWLEEYESGPMQIGDYLISLEHSGSGNLKLLPAGNPPSPEYPGLLTALYDAISRTGMNGGPDLDSRLERLKSDIRRLVRPDFLLLDARTGISPLGAAALYNLADTVVVLTVSNPESLAGCRAIIRGLFEHASATEKTEPNVLPVVTRLPYDSPDARMEVDGIRSYLSEAAVLSAQQGQALSGGLQPLTVLHSQPDLQLLEELHYKARYSLKESLLMRGYLAFWKLLAPDQLDKSGYSCLAKAMERPETTAYLDYSPTAIHRAVCLRDVLDDIKVLGRLKYACPPSDVGSKSLLEVCRLVVKELVSELGVSEGLIDGEEIDHSLLSFQLNQGYFDFYLDVFYLTADRARSVDILPFGALQNYCACAKASSRLTGSRGKTTVSLQEYIRRVCAKGDPSTLHVGLLGETSAASHAGPLLHEFGIEIEVRHKEEALAKWLFGSADEDEGINRIALCDHVTLLRMQQVPTPEGVLPLCNIVYEQPVPVGLLLPQGNSPWRQAVASSFLRVITRQPEKWAEAMEELREHGIKSEGIRGLLRRIPLELEPKRAIEWLENVF